MIASSTRKAERDDQRAERDALQVESHRVLTTNTTDGTSGTDSHGDSGAQAERQETDGQHDRQRLDEGA